MNALRPNASYIVTLQYKQTNNTLANEARFQFFVTQSPLYACIAGSRRIYLPLHQTLKLDASLSVDPDIGIPDTGLIYQWDCVDAATKLPCTDS